MSFNKLSALNTGKKEYFYNIDFFRFVFIISIAFSHTKSLVKYPEIPIFDYILNRIQYSYTSVEMFFVIAGFFLFYTLNLKHDFISL